MNRFEHDLRELILVYSQEVNLITNYINSSGGKGDGKAWLDLRQDCLDSIEELEGILNDKKK